MEDRHLNPGTFFPTPECHFKELLPDITQKLDGVGGICHTQQVFSENNVIKLVLIQMSREVAMSISLVGRPD